VGETKAIYQRNIPMLGTAAHCGPKGLRVVSIRATDGGKSWTGVSAVQNASAQLCLTCPIEYSFRSRLAGGLDCGTR